MVKRNRFEEKLEKITRNYFAANPHIKIVALAGSTGKSMARAAVATVLSQQFKVRMRDISETTTTGVLLSLLGIDHQDVTTGFMNRRRLLRAARYRLKNPDDIEIIIQDFPANNPEDVQHFAEVIRPFVAIITSVSPRNMGQFQTLEALAREELSLANFSAFGIINRDDIQGEYANYLTNPNLTTYGADQQAEYSFAVTDFTPQVGYSGSFVIPDWAQPHQTIIPLIGEHNLRAAVVAVATAVKLGMTEEVIAKGISLLQPLNGEMHMLDGVNDAVIIDDSLHTNPIEAASSLRTLYQIAAPQRIVVFGSMPQLGQYAQVEHQTIAELCDPNQLSWVVTVGVEAAEHLAPIARARGCQVKSFTNTLEAGAFVHSVMEREAVVLFDGSRADMLEEAIKIILLRVDDQRMLVRQTPEWLAYKATHFSHFR